MKNKSKIVRGINFTLVSAFFIAYMVPFFLVFINSFKIKRDIIKNPLALIPENGYNFDNYIQAFKKMDFFRALGNSLFITILSVSLVLVFSSMVAYYFVRGNNIIMKIFFPMMIASMLIPFQAIMLPTVIIFGMKLQMLDHRLTVVLFQLGAGMSLNVFVFQGFIKTGVPLALEEAANLDGCTKPQTFFRIVFPLLKPIMATMAVLGGLASWNDYLLPSLVLKSKKLLTLPLATYAFYGTYSADYGLIMAGLVLVIIPVMIFYFTMQKQVIKGVVAGAIKS
jgi:raffinose/stachyose/melibiose transport system permease protein